MPIPPKYPPRTKPPIPAPRPGLPSAPRLVTSPRPIAPAVRPPSPPLNADEYEKTNDMSVLPPGCDPLRLGGADDLELSFNQTVPLQMPEFPTDVNPIMPDAGGPIPISAKTSPAAGGAKGADPLVSCEMQIKTRMMEAMPDIDEKSEFRRESSLSTMSTSNFEAVPSQASLDTVSPGDPGSTVITEIVDPFSKRGFSKFLDTLITKHFGVLIFLICTVIVLTALTVLAIMFWK